MSDSFFTPEDLAQRWEIMLTTLDQWRWSGKGPIFTKIGGKVRYSVKDVEHYEQQRRYRHTAAPITTKPALAKVAAISPCPVSTFCEKYDPIHNITYNANKNSGVNIGTSSATYRNITGNPSETS